MGKLMLGLLGFVSATASAFGYSPLQPQEPIASIFGLVVGLFALVVALAANGQIPELQPSRKTAREDFGGGGASGKW